MSEHFNHAKKQWWLNELLGKRVYSQNGYYLGTVKNCAFEEVGGVAYLNSIVVSREKFKKIDLWKPLPKPNLKTAFKRRVPWSNVKQVTKDEIIIKRWKG